MIYGISIVSKYLCGYTKKCMFGMFVILCRLDYIGSSIKFKSMIAVTEVCKNISFLNQYYKDNNGYFNLLSPD